MDRDQLDFIAEKENLELVETTSAINGYPQNLKPALIGLDTFEQAEKLSKEYGLSITYFKKKDGWILYYREGGIALGPIEPTIDDYGDDYEILYKRNLDSFYEDRVKGMVSEFDSFDEIKAFLDNEHEIFDKLDDAEDDEMVLLCCGKYQETIPCKCMSFYYDTWETVIGLIDNN